MGRRTDIRRYLDLIFKRRPWTSQSRFSAALHHCSWWKQAPMGNSSCSSLTTSWRSPSHSSVQWEPPFSYLPRLTVVNNPAQSADGPDYIWTPVPPLCPPVSLLGPSIRSLLVSQKYCCFHDWLLTMLACSVIMRPLMTDCCWWITRIIFHLFKNKNQ